MFLDEFDRLIYDFLRRSHQPRNVLELERIYSALHGHQATISQISGALRNLALLGLAENTEKGWVAVTDFKKIQAASNRLLNEAMDLVERVQPEEAILRTLAQSEGPLSARDIHAEFQRLSKWESDRALDRLLRYGLVISTNGKFELYPTLKGWLDDQLSQALFLSRAYIRALES